MESKQDEIKKSKMEKGKLRFLLLLFLTGCVPVEVETNQALIDTRGWPVTQVIIEGPGGDRTTVEFEMVRSNAFMVEVEMTLYFICSALLLLLLLTRREFYPWRRKKKEKAQ